MTPRSGRPSASPKADTISNVREMVLRDCRLNQRLSDELNINTETIHQILHEDLRTRKICAQFVPYKFTDEQKQKRLTPHQEFIQICQDNPNFLVVKGKTAARKEVSGC
jgi:hypothetical protein